jgi:microsomal dipeptidase-like Zn-dependent dipeptidase
VKKMHKKDFYVDFHCHATLRAMNSAPAGKQGNLWEKTVNPEFRNLLGRWAQHQTREIASESQTSFSDYAASKTRVIFDSLYPVEKGWYRFRRLPSLLIGAKSKEIMMSVTFGIENKRMHMLGTSEGYFNELEDAYQFLTGGQGSSPDGSVRYQVVRNSAELESVLSMDDNTIAVIVTVEGAHALECGAPCTENISVERHKEIISENIRKIKSWQYPVFSINLAHHFYNQLCGHARSMKRPVSIMFKQDKGINEGITDLGWYVINSLLEQKNGKRILIDTKHMSVKSRKEYYNFISEYNRQNPENKIPVICSHSAVNGFATMADSVRKADLMKKFRGQYFNNWSINLSDEEINLIHESGGIIGIMMDKSLLASPVVLREIKNIHNSREKKNALIRLFLDNIFQIVKAIGKKSAWDCIVSGTDYDGIITHLDSYRNAASLSDFRQDLTEFLDEFQYRSELWYDLQPSGIVEKIFRDNSLMFLNKYFN